MSVIDDLAALQDHDGIIRELEQQVNDIPIRRNQELEKIKVEHEDYERAKEVVQTLRTEVTRGELYSAELKETIQKFRIQTPSLKTQAALDAMMSQISKAEGDLKAAENSVIETHLKIFSAEEGRVRSKRFSMRAMVSCFSTKGFLTENSAGLGTSPK